MEQLEVIRKIKTKEQEAEGIIEEAKRKAASMIKEAKLIKKEQILKAFSYGQETPINHPTLPHYSRDEYYNDNYNQNK